MRKDAFDLAVLVAKEGGMERFRAHIPDRLDRVSFRSAICKGSRGFLPLGARPPVLVELERLEPVHVAAYVEQLRQSRSAPSVKQHLAAVRMLFDWLVLGRVVKSNPAAVVRGPKHVVKRGKSPVLAPEEARLLFESNPDRQPGRALIGVLIYSFGWLRLHEKGGKNHEMPVTTA